MRHRNLPPAAVLPLGNALGGQGRGGHPSGCPGTPASRAIPISGCSVAQGCSRLGVQPPPDEVPAQKATRSQQRLLRTFTATSCPPNRPPEGHPGAGGWFWGGGSGCPHNSAAAPRAPHCPSAARGLQPAEHRLGVSSTTALPRGGEGAAGKRLPPPRRALPAFTGTGPAAPSRGLPSSPGSSPGRQRLPARRGLVSSVR